MAGHGLRAKKAHINPYIWCAVGAAIGWLGGKLMTSPTRGDYIENLLVAVFGALIGGEFVASYVLAPVKDDAFRIGALITAVISAIVALLLLRLMRRVVGPMQESKAKPKRNY